MNVIRRTTMRGKKTSDNNDTYIGGGSVKLVPSMP